jgi:hypothetical protein
VNSHSSCVPCQPRSAFFPTKQTNKLTILVSSIYETSAGLQQNLEIETTILGSTNQQINTVLTILVSSIYETSAGLQQNLEIETTILDSTNQQINDTGFQYLRNLGWSPAESRYRNNYTGFHKLTILVSSIYETSAGLQQNLENEIENRNPVLLTLFLFPETFQDAAGT